MMYPVDEGVFVFVYVYEVSVGAVCMMQVSKVSVFACDRSWEWVESTTNMFSILTSNPGGPARPRTLGWIVLGQAKSCE